MGWNYQQVQEFKVRVLFLVFVCIFACLSSSYADARLLLAAYIDMCRQKKRQLTKAEELALAATTQVVAQISE
jgi:hypothetical protein